MSAVTHQGLYRNTPLVLGGLLAAIAMLVGAIVVAMQVATTGDELLQLVLGALAAFVLGFAGCMLAALRRHRWTIEADAVLIEERPLVPLTGLRRVRRVPFGTITSLSRVQNAADELLAIVTDSAGPGAAVAPCSADAAYRCECGPRPRPCADGHPQRGRAAVGAGGPSGTGQFGVGAPSCGCLECGTAGGSTPVTNL